MKVYIFYKQERNRKKIQVIVGGTGAAV